MGLASEEPPYPSRYSTSYNFRVSAQVSTIIHIRCMQMNNILTLMKKHLQPKFCKLCHKNLEKFELAALLLS